MTYYTESALGGKISSNTKAGAALNQSIQSMYDKSVKTYESSGSGANYKLTDVTASLGSPRGLKGAIP